MARLLGGLAAVLVLFAGWAVPALAQQGLIKVVAAENVYGDLASQLGGALVHVTSIINNPGQDPHLFEASPATARALAAAAIVIVNGAGYDPWIEKLLSVTGGAGRQVIVVAELTHRRPGDNPHLWYLPDTMPTLAKALSAALSARDRAHERDYAARLRVFEASLTPLQQRIAEIRDRFQGATITATEPVFGYMAEALGLAMRNERFQLAVMNDTEPSAADVAAFEDDLRHHRVRVLLYNSQTSDALTERLKRIAHEAGIPVVGVTETQPSGKTYQQWMLDQLEALQKALSGAAS